MANAFSAKINSISLIAAVNYFGLGAVGRRRVGADGYANINVVPRLFAIVFSAMK